MTFGYVCTNFNNTSYTAEAVDSLTHDSGHRYQIVVVDNNSDAKNLDALKALSNKYSNVDVLLMPENLGYFRGLNEGIRKIRREHPHIDVLVVGNNDLVFPEGFGDALALHLDKLQQYPVIAPNIETLDGVHQNPHVIREVSKAREAIYDVYYSNYAIALLVRKLASATRYFTDRSDELQYQIAQPIYQGHGSCYILGPKFFEHFDELWAPTFMMGEEFFLSKQLSDHGMQKFYEPSIHVLHHCHGALRELPSRRSWEMAREAHRVYRRYVRGFKWRM